MLPRAASRSFLGLFVLLGSATASGQTRRSEEPPPATSPEAMTLELGLYGGLFFASDRHELYDPLVPHRGIDSPSADLGLRAGFFPSRFLGAEVEGALLPLSIEGGGRGTGYTVRGHLMLQYPARITPFAVVGGGGLGVSSANDELGDDADGAFHWGLGAKAYLTELLSVRLDGRHIVAPSLDDTAAGEEPSITSHFELLAGLSITFPRAEREDDDPDEDGIRGRADRCPGRPGGPPDGCPRRDSDGDGIDDREDTCPKVRGVPPDGCPRKDSDDDGVPDADDACPEVAGEKPSGCPSDDPDGDGVRGEDDACPDEKGASSTGGCPDADGDGIPDGKDACPNEKETLNDYEDADGCPDEIPDAVKRFTGAIEGLRFASGSAEIERSSHALLDRAVEVLQAFPEVRLEIDGHTDNTGDHDENVKLSLTRAQAVMRYLIDAGVDATRLEAKGFGPDQPVDTNKTRVGRAKNRRIEFNLIQ